MALDPNIGRIKFLRSKTAGLTPTTADIDEGELALNLVDRTIYTRNGNNIIDMGFGKGGQVNGNITASGTVKATKLEGPLTGNATTATSLQNARTINGISFNGTANIEAPANRYVITKDQRALKPVDLAVNSAGFYFTSLGGMTGTANSTYGDLITLNSYGDSSGGNQNALFFHKRAMQILHYQSTSFGAGTWGTPKTLAYTDSSITGNADTATKLQTSRTISLTGGVTGSVNFDGSANASIAATVTGLGVANGIATLDSSGQVPSTQLPSYVDDVLEYLNVAAFPTTGESGKIYVETTGNTTYRWSGSAYVKITSGEVASVAGKTGVVTLTKSDVGLSNVDNTSDIDKPISTATQTALNSKINLSEKGVANGVATLNSSVEIPIAQIPYRIFNKVIGIGGEGVDLTMTGLYDRNQLALADKEHTVTATITGAGRFDSDDVSFKDIVFNQSSNFATLSGCDATTQLVVTINLSSTLTNYSRAVWQPFVQTRLDTSQSFRNIQVEVQDTSNVWYSPDASNVTNITYIPKSGMYIFPELNPGTASIKAIRFTFTNPNTTNGVVYMSNIGFRHVSHTYAPQYLHRGFNNTIYGTNTFTNTIIGSISGNSGTATSLQTARTIAISGAVTGTATSFNGSANIAIATTAIDGSKISTGTIPAARIPTLNQSTTGNAGSATKLQTARLINGVDFDGTTDIQIDAIRVGTISWHLGNRSSVFTGDLVCDGQVLNRADYPELWNMVNAGRFASVTDAVWLSDVSKRGAYSTGNGSTTFRLPDLNGGQAGSIPDLFLRGTKATNAGTVLDDAIRNITGAFGTIADQYSSSSASGSFEKIEGGYSQWLGHSNGANGNLGSFSFNASRVVPTADENRPKSVFGIWVVSAKGSNVAVPGGSTAATLTGGNTFQGSQTINGDLIVNQNETVKGNLTVEGLTADRFGLHDKMHWVGACIQPYGTSVLNASVTTNTFQVIIKGESGAKYWTKGRTKLHFIINHGTPQNARFVTATVTDWSTTDSNKQTITATLSLVNHDMPLNTVFHWVGSTYESFGCDWAGWMNSVGGSRMVMRLKPTTPLKSLTPIITSSCSSDSYWNASQLSQPGVEPQQRSEMGSTVINSVHEGDVVFAIGDNNSDRSVSNEYVSISVKDFV